MGVMTAADHRIPKAVADVLADVRAERIDLGALASRLAAE